MNNSDKITTINKVLADYFGKHPGCTVMAKDMMNDFIEAGVFPSDKAITGTDTLIIPLSYHLLPILHRGIKHL